MNQIKLQKHLSTLDLLVRIVLAVIFLLAAFPKLLDPVSFAKSITNYRIFLPLIGQNYIYSAAAFLPALEAVSALGMFYYKTRRASCLTVFVLLIVFTAMVAQAVARGFNIDCGCFGSGNAGAALAQKVGTTKLIENSLMILAAGWVWWRSGRQTFQLKG